MKHSRWVSQHFQMIHFPSELLHIMYLELAVLVVIKDLINIYLSSWVWCIMSELVKHFQPMTNTILMFSFSFFFFFWNEQLNKTTQLANSKLKSWLDYYMNDRTITVKNKVKEGSCGILLWWKSGDPLTYSSDWVQ